MENNSTTENLEDIDYSDLIIVYKSDLETLCHAIIENAVYYDYNDNGPSYYKCNYCDARSDAEYDVKYDSFVHEQSCPFLIAQDLYDLKNQLKTTNENTLVKGEDNNCCGKCCGHCDSK